MVNIMIKKILVIACLSFFLLGCHDEKLPKVKPNEVMTVQPKPLTSHFYYSGVIQPLKAVVVTSPADGVIEDMPFHYGDQVSAKQPLFTIYSDKFQSEYKTALMQYIKAKTEFNQAGSQLKEAEFLHKNELISEDDFKGKQTAFYTAQLALVQAEDTLNTMLKQMNVKGLNLYALTIKDIDKITQALHSHDDSQKLHIFSPTEGVALVPIKGESDGQTKKLTKGEQVKQGDVLAMIGDVSGLSIHINVNEFNINQIKVGQTVKVTGTAFPQFILSGRIANLDRQGQISSGGMPQFPVEIIVPTLTEEQQKLIHIGMSAKVEIQLEEESVLTVPIAAVFEKNGSTHVKVQKDKNTIDLPVKTGKTTPNAVVIEANLKAGEKIVLPH